MSQLFAPGLPDRPSSGPRGRRRALARRSRGDRGRRVRGRDRGACAARGAIARSRSWPARGHRRLRGRASSTEVVWRRVAFPLSLAAAIAVVGLVRVVAGCARRRTRSPCRRSSSSCSTHPCHAARRSRRAARGRADFMNGSGPGGAERLIRERRLLDNVLRDVPAARCTISPDPLPGIRTGCSCSSTAAAPTSATCSASVRSRPCSSTAGCDSARPAPPAARRRPLVRGSEIGYPDPETFTETLALASSGSTRSQPTRASPRSGRSSGVSRREPS